MSLLLGHIQLHGLQQTEQAAISYKRVLEGDVDATIAALAEQGLERCRAEDITSGAGTTTATNGAIPDLLKDPSPTPAPVPEPVPSPKPTLTPEANSDAKVEVEMANQEPALSEEEPPLVAVDPAPQEPAAKDLLENSWLRVQLKPDIKNPTDSVEPMGLINRIKGAFARSAGR